MDRRRFIGNTAYAMATTLLPFHLFADVLNNVAANDLLIPEAEIMKVEMMNTLTSTVKYGGQDVKIHCIQTGTVAIKESHRSNPVAHFLTPLKISLDRDFTEDLPIWCWVIEHPEGIILIDTGENSGVMNPDYFTPAGKMVASYSKKNFRFLVKKENELGFQLQKLGITKDRIKKIVLTHLHLDHTDGLKDFEGVEIILNEAEFKNPVGHIPKLYPSWFDPTLVNYRQGLVDVFTGAYPITSSEDLLLIPTNGHTYHHASVLFRTDHFDILFAGDISYNEQQLLDSNLAGINANYKASRRTYEDVLQYANMQNTIYLPSHDPRSGDRLKNAEFIVTKN